MVDVLVDGRFGCPIAESAHVGLFVLLGDGWLKSACVWRVRRLVAVVAVG